MNVTGEFTVNAPRDVVFKTLRDAQSFVRFVDGVQDLKEIDPTHYEAVFETRVAYLKFKFNVTVEVTNVEEPSVIEAKIEGTPLGVVGRLTAKSITRLEDAGAETKVTYSVESTLAGKLGSIGAPVLRSKAKDMEKLFAERLRAAFAAKPAGG
jgi:carbon monoxide dehydrogenase subunit G